MFPMFLPWQVSVIGSKSNLSKVVQVPVPDKESKNTPSIFVGAEAPGAPPEVADQLAVDVLSQVPVPPTQRHLLTFVIRFR